MTPQASPLALRLALRLYPAAYRAEHATELATTLRDVTAEAPRSERLREYASLTGTALLLRAGLGRTGLPGRVLAQAAPLMAAVAAGGQLLYWLYSAHRLTQGRWDWTQPGDPLTKQLWGYDQALLLPLLWILALGAAFAARWGAFRFLALLASLNAACLAFMPSRDVVYLGSLVPNVPDIWTAPAGILSALLVLAPARELLETVRWQWFALPAVTLGAALIWFLADLVYSLDGFLDGRFGFSEYSGTASMLAWAVWGYAGIGLALFLAALAVVIHPGRTSRTQSA